MTAPKKLTKGEAMMWLFTGTINDHIMRCKAARFPDEHPECREKDCPNCCGTCSTLQWFRDEQDVYLRRLLNRYGEGLHDWQLASGAVDWAQIEAHWDDSGMACNREPCLQAEAKRLEMEAWSDEALEGWSRP